MLTTLLFAMCFGAHAGKTKIDQDQPLPEGAKVAVVQYAVDALNAGKGHTVKMDAGEVDRSIDRQLGLLERALGESGLFGEVVPYASFAANDAYRDYQGATSPEEISETERRVKLLDTATIAALGTSGACLLVSSIFWLSRPSNKLITDEIESIESDIRSLEDELR